MADITVVWNPVMARGDWAMGDGDILTGGDLATSVLISLFTDKRATEDYVPPPGDIDRRGWWADAYAVDQIGSNLWQLERHTKTQDTLNLAISYAQVALQWMIDDGVASTVAVVAEWQGDSALVLAMQVTITEATGAISLFKYSWAWGTI